MLEKNNVLTYNQLIDKIGNTIDNARERAYIAVHTEVVVSNWQIGQYIVEFEQEGKDRAKYGKELLTHLAKDLKIRYGKGYSKSNIYLMRLFYLKYPIFQTVSGKLSWGHYCELVTVTDEYERKFYEQHAINEKLSIRELRRQIDSSLFERLALSKDKKGVLELSKKGQIISKPKDIVKEPFVLEFLKIPENYRYNEKQLETKIIDNLQLFLLELGKGFAFISRQYRITIDNTNFYVDLVFYHRILKCFVLIDLKVRKVKHGDIGQMNMYLNYFKTEENVKGDNPPIGIILTKRKHEILVEYATGGISNKIFVSKYQLYLPDKEQLLEKLHDILDEDE